MNYLLNSRNEWQFGHRQSPMTIIDVVMQWSDLVHFIFKRIGEYLRCFLGFFELVLLWE